MAFFVSICLLLRVIVSYWVYEFLIGTRLILTTGGGSSGHDQATDTEIRNKVDELEHANKRLQNREERREELNDMHSRAGDDCDEGLERHLGRELGKADREIDSIKEWIKQIIEWLAN